MSSLASFAAAKGRQYEEGKRREEEELKRKQEAERKRIEHNENVSTLANIQSQADIDTLERLNEESRADPEGATERTLKWFDAYRKEKVESAPERARPALEADFNRMRSRVHATAFNMEIKGRQSKVLREQEDGIDTDARALLADPSSFNEMLARRRATASQLDIPEDARARLTAKASETLVMAAATGYAQQNPRETLEAFGQGGPRYDEATRKKVQEALARGESGVGVVPGMVRPGVFDSADAEQAFMDSKAPRAALNPALSMVPFDRVDDITRIARTTIERNVSSLRVGLSDKAKDVQAAVMSGVPVSREDVAGVAEQYTTAYGPVEGARRYQDEIAVPLAVGEGIGRLKAASPQERAALIAGAKPNGVDGAAEQKVIHDALLQANSIVEKQLREDPATYVSSFPRVATALQALDSAPPESRAAAVAAYAYATIAEQERLGAPTPRLLTGAQSDAIVKAFSEQPPERASDVIAGLEMEWGKHWPMVYKQLVQENKLTPAAIVIPNMKDQGSRARMASASALKLEDLKGLVPSGDAKDVRDKLQGYFEPAAKTLFTQSVGGMSTATTIMDQAEKLALVYRTQGKSVNDSAKQAYDEVIGWKYEFADTYRVPREQQPEMVTRGAAAALRDLGRVAMFDSPYPMGSGNRARQSLDAIKANGYWVTNDDETGVILKVRGRDNSEYTAYREDGARIEYKWQDLRRIAGDDVAGERRMIESGRATEMNQAKKRQQAEEEARQQRLRDMGLR